MESNSHAQTKWTITADKFLSADQVQKLLDHLASDRDLALARGTSPQVIRDYYLIRGMLETGLRVSEFCSLTNADFHGLKVHIRRGKGGKPRTVLLTRSTSNLFKEWLGLKASLGYSTEPVDPLFPSRFRRRYTSRGVQKRVKLTFETLGFPNHLSAHSLRHTYCSLLIASGKVGLATVRDNLGHHSISVTNLYTHAVGSIEDVELLPASSSENYEKDELVVGSETAKSKSMIKQRLSKMRKANFQKKAPTRAGDGGDV